VFILSLSLSLSLCLKSQPLGKLGARFGAVVREGGFCYHWFMRKTMNLTALAKKYGEGYVARVSGTARVMAFAKKVDQLLEKIKDKKEFKENKLTISWIPKYGQKYSFKISLRVC